MSEPGRQLPERRDTRGMRKLPGQLAHALLVCLPLGNLACQRVVGGAQLAGALGDTQFQFVARSGQPGGELPLLVLACRQFAKLVVNQSCRRTQHREIDSAQEQQNNCHHGQPAARNQKTSRAAACSSIVTTCSMPARNFDS